MLLTEHDDVACIAFGLDRREGTGDRRGKNVRVWVEIAVPVARDVGGHRGIVDGAVHVVVVRRDVRFQSPKLPFDLGHTVCAWSRNLPSAV